MIVKCIKIISPATGEDLGEQSPWLIKDKLYIVFAVRYDPREKNIEVLLESENYQDPQTFDFNQFEIISNKLSSYWIVGKDEAKCLCFMPQAWFLQKDFWGGMDDGDESVLSIYRQYRDLMIEEDPLNGFPQKIASIQ